MASRPVKGWGDILDICIQDAIAKLGPGRTTLEYLKHARAQFELVHETAQKIAAEEGIPLFGECDVWPPTAP